MKHNFTLKVFIIIGGVHILSYGASQVALAVKNSSANAEDVRNVGSILGSERSSGGGHGNTLQCPCLENSMDREAWWVTVHRVAKETGTTEMI